MLRRKKEKGISPASAEEIRAEELQERGAAGASVAEEEGGSASRENDNEEENAAPGEKDEASDDTETASGEAASESEGDSAETGEPESAVMAGFRKWLAVQEGDEGRRERAESAMKLIERAFLTGSAEEDVFVLVAKGADYDHAVACAEKSGEIRGRNASIEELMAEERATDGVPHPGTGSGGFADGRAPSIFELARGAM